MTELRRRPIRVSGYMRNAVVLSEDSDDEQDIINQQDEIGNFNQSFFQQFANIINEIKEENSIIIFAFIFASILRTAYSAYSSKDEIIETSSFDFISIYFLL